METCVVTSFVFRWSNYCFLAEKFYLSFSSLSLFNATLKPCQHFWREGLELCCSFDLLFTFFTYSEHLVYRFFKIVYYFLEIILPFQLPFNFLLIRVFYMQFLFLKLYQYADRIL